jgi:hypothetical protein
MRMVTIILLSVFFLTGICYAGTTGKIAGSMLDAQTGDPLPGARSQIRNSDIICFAKTGTGTGCTDGLISIRRTVFLRNSGIQPRRFFH